MTGPQYPQSAGPQQLPPQQYGQPVYQQPQRPVKRKRGAGGIIGIILAIIVISIGSWAVGFFMGAAGKVVSAITATDTPVGAANGSTKSATTKTAAGKSRVVLAPLKGSGSKSTGKFTTGNDWTIHYSYDCSHFLGGTGNFAISLGGSDLNEANVNTLGKKETSTEPVFDDPGTHYLSILSECPWTVSVTSP